MKQCLIPLCLFLLAMTLEARGIREDIAFTSDKARSSYAFGMTVGNELKESGLEIDYTAFTEGLRATMEERATIMDWIDALEIVQDAFESAMRRQSAELLAAEEAFLIENAARPGIIVTASGLQYEIIEEGNGPYPTENDIVRVHYEGTLIDGSLFDSSYDRGDPEEIPLDMVIPGWAEGIQLMSVGSTHRIYLPSNLAYGERGAGQIIPPYSTLIFTVDLFAIVSDDDDWGSATDPDSEN